MAGKKPNMFSTEAANRHQEQETLATKLTAPESLDPEKKVRMNIMLYPEFKKRLQAEADKNHISVSHLIQLWIDVHC